MDIANSIVSNSKSTSLGGIDACCGSAPSISYTDVWTSNAGVANYVGVADPTGSSGNISADPRFVNESQDDFRLNTDRPRLMRPTARLQITRLPTPWAMRDIPIRWSATRPAFLT